MADSDPKFKILFTPGAAKDYKDLDPRLQRLVENKINELSFRADEVGKLLSNNSNTKLAGCREIKLKDAGYRIVYRVVGDRVEIEGIVMIIAIARRDEDEVFVAAHQRIQERARTTAETLAKMPDDLQRAIQSIIHLKK